MQTNTPSGQDTRQAAWRRLIDAITARIDPDLPGMMIEPDTDRVINDQCSYDQPDDPRPDFVREDDEQCGFPWPR